MPFIPHTPEDTTAMLSAIGVKHMDDLFADIPADMRPQSFDLPEGLSEYEAFAYLNDLAAANTANITSFMGAGAYDHAIPAAVDALSSRGEFLTSYTPYQPEAAQGTLQAIFEYQTAMCRLMEMDAANASVYDGGSAIFEAAMMAIRATKRWELVVDETINPMYRIMLDTLVANQPITVKSIPHVNGCPDMAALEAALTDETAAVIVQNPGFFGALYDYSALFAKASANKSKSIMLVSPVMQSVLKTPGEMGADIAVAEGQSIGLPLGFGGPYLGIMTCAKDIVRQMPGRIVGRTEDIDGKSGYVLTLQAREQHIRRAKATSNICSNQSLCALRSIIHLSLLGPEGLIRTAELSMLRAREAASKLTALPGVSLMFDAPYGYEFALTLPVKASAVVKELAQKRIIAGVPVCRWYSGLENVLLVACTEKTTPAAIDALAKAMSTALSNATRGAK